MDDSREYENTVNNEELKKEPSSGNNAPELSSGNSDDDVINRLYTEYSDYNKDRIPSFVDTPEFEKSAADFCRIKRLLCACIVSLLAFPFFMPLYLYTLISAVKADYSAFSFMKKHRTSALYKDIKKLGILHLCEICLLIFMLALIAHGCLNIGSFHALTFLAAGTLLMASCYTTWPLVLKTSEKFRNREPETVQSNPLTCKPKYETSLVIFGIIVLVLNVFLAAYSYDFYEGIDFNNRHLSKVGPILREYRQCIIDHGGLNYFEEGEPVHYTVRRECRSIEKFKTDDNLSVHVYSDYLKITFFLPETNYKAQIFYQTVNGKKSLIWKASPESSCAERLNCLAPDPNLL